MAKRRPKSKRPQKDVVVDVETSPGLEPSVRPSGLNWLFVTSKQTNLIIYCVVLGLVVASVFLPVLANGFVQWDDDITLYRNPHVQGLDFQRLQWMFTDVSYSLRYKPLSWLTIAVIHAVGGLNPFCYHLVSLLFHCANAVLVFLVFRRVMVIHKGNEAGAPLFFSVIAGLAALMWAVHPLRVEVIARVTDMTFCQSVFFVLVSLLCYLRAVQFDRVTSGSRKWYWASVIAFGLAMFTYPVVFAFPLILLVLDYNLLGRFKKEKPSARQSDAKRIWLEKVPFFVLSSILIITVYGGLNPSGIWKDQELSDSFGLFHRGMQAFYIWAYFVWKPFVPFNLSPVYTTLVSFNPLEWLFVGSALLVVGLTCLLFWKRRQWPVVWALWICHLIFMIPVLGLTSHPFYASDRYSYGQGILLSALAAAGLVKICQRSNLWLWPVAVTSILITASLAVMSIRQMGIWHDSITLFKYVLVKLGDDPYRVDIIGRLGDQYFGQGNFDEAIVTYRQLVPLMPGNAKLRNNLGILLMRRGRYDEALIELREAIKLDPQAANLRKNLGDLYARMERYEEAVPQYEESIRSKRDDAETQNNLGLVLMKKGEVSKAVTHFQEAAKLQPQNTQVHANLENALRSLNATPGNSSNP